MAPSPDEKAKFSWRYECMGVFLWALTAIDDVGRSDEIVDVAELGKIVVKDNGAALKKTASAHGADDRWQVARANASGTREVAALLGVQYRRLADGDFNHSSTILLLDAEGRINARTNTRGAVDPKLVDAMRKLVAAQRYSTCNLLATSLSLANQASLAQKKVVRLQCLNHSPNRSCKWL